SKAHRLEPLLLARAREVAQLVAHPLPGLAFMRGQLGRCFETDLHVGDDLQPGMRPIELDPRDAIAKGIEVLAAYRRLRLRLGVMFQAVQPRGGAGQMWA